MLIAGENAHSRYYSEDIYKMASSPKELVIVAGADHVDLYDKLDVIPFEKLTAFFTEHLNSGTPNKDVKNNEIGATKLKIVTK
jgi:uncharacterized protein